MNAFAIDLSTSIWRHCFEFHTDNVDYVTYPNAVPSLFGRIGDTLKAVSYRTAGRFHFHRMTPSALKYYVGEFQAVAPLFDGLNGTYQLLADEEFRRLMVSVFAYRILGPRHVKLERNDSQYHHFVELVDTALLSKPHTAAIDGLGGYLNRYNLQLIGTPIELDAHPLNILCTFLLEQYRYERSGHLVEASAGDYVIDGGGCWGDTALYFANRVGPNGRVFSFEFSPDNLPILCANLERNIALQSRVTLVENALWDVSGEQLSFAAKGSGTSLTKQRLGEHTVKTLSIDDLVEREEPQHLDFIKMDIEGAELAALQGAEKTIRQFRPKLAIALYHSPQGFVSIPQWLSNLKLGYQFFLGHYSIHAWETVLYGSPPI